MKYLFDAAPQMNGRTNEYLHAVNLIYQVITVFAGVWSQLWPKVTIRSWTVFLRLTRTGVKHILVSICFSPSQYHSATQSWPQLGEVHHCTVVPTNLTLPQSQIPIHAATKKNSYPVMLRNNYLRMRNLHTEAPLDLFCYCHVLIYFDLPRNL